MIESLDKDGDSLINFEEYLKYIPVPEPIPDEKPVADESVKIVPMSDEDFEDEDENRNEFEQEWDFFIVSRRYIQFLRTKCLIKINFTDISGIYTKNLLSEVSD